MLVTLGTQREVDEAFAGGLISRELISRRLWHLYIFNTFFRALRGKNLMNCTVKLSCFLMHEVALKPYKFQDLSTAKPWYKKVN